MVPRTESDLAHFFATDLLKELKALEKVRLAVLARVKTMLGIAAGVFAMCLGVDFLLDLDGKLGVISGFICLAAGFYAYKILTREYVGQFKARVIRRIIEFIDPGLTYLADGHVSRETFHSSRIFQRYPDRLRGDDLVQRGLQQGVPRQDRGAPGYSGEAVRGNRRVPSVSQQVARGAGEAREPGIREVLRGLRR
jgi:hypothetical protein